MAALSLGNAVKQALTRRLGFPSMATVKETKTIDHPSVPGQFARKEQFFLFAQTNHDRCDLLPIRRSTHNPT